MGKVYICLCGLCVVSVCGVCLRVCVCVSHVHLLTKKQKGDSGVVSVLPSTLFP